MSDLKSILNEAASLLAADKTDEAIDILRVEESTENAEICTLLAQV